MPAVQRARRRLGRGRRQDQGHRVDGGWLVNGQKVWTSGAQYAGSGLATVRTDPDVPKHAGITTMVIDMHAPGVEVRPLRETTGNSEFNEVFFNDVFVPDDDVVGPVDGGWTVARATLGNERRQHRWRRRRHADSRRIDLLDLLDRHADRLHRWRRTRRAAPGRGADAAAAQPARRRAGRRRRRARTRGQRDQAGAGRARPRAAPPSLADAARSGSWRSSTAPAPSRGITAVVTRAMSIAGGTSEITRNQIGERILGLPRDPLLR